MQDPIGFWDPLGLSADKDEVRISGFSAIRQRLFLVNLIVSHTCASRQLSSVAELWKSSMEGSRCARAAQIFHKFFVLFCVLSQDYKAV